MALQCWGGIQKFLSNRVVERIWNHYWNQCPTSTPTKWSCRMHDQNNCWKAPTLHFTACLLASWWEFTMDHAIHLINHTPIKWLDWKTPLEVVSGLVPDFTKYKVFGCATYVYLPEEVHPKKMGPRSELMTHIGYEPSTKGFKFMYVSNTIFITAMATFDENLFPCCPIAHTPCSRPLHSRPFSGPVEYAFKA